MTDNTTKFSIPRLFLGLGGAFFVAALVLAVGGLIILATGTEAYLNLEQTMERLLGN